MSRSGIIFPSAARTKSGAIYGNQFGSGGARGVLVTIDATVRAGASSVVFKIQGLDPASGKWYDILTSAAVASVSTVHLRVHPELTAAANTVAKDGVPDQMRVEATHANTDSITYSVGFNLLG